MLPCRAIRRDDDTNRQRATNSPRIGSSSERHRRQLVAVIAGLIGYHAFAFGLIVSLGLLTLLIEMTGIMPVVVGLVAVHDPVVYPAADRFRFEPENPRENDG